MFSKIRKLQNILKLQKKVKECEIYKNTESCKIITAKVSD